MCDEEKLGPEVTLLAVRNLAWLLQDSDGAWSALVLGVNNPDAEWSSGLGTGLRLGAAALRLIKEAR